MAWELHIQTIDVGQGDCGLIVAADGATNTQRSLLVDGGHKNYAWIIHDTLRVLNLDGVDAMLVTHYEGDHMGGIVALLEADNIWHMSDTIAGVAVGEANGASRAEQLAAVAAAIVAGSYGAIGPLFAPLLDDAVRRARKYVKKSMNDVRAVDVGVTQAETVDYAGAPTVLPRGSARVKKIATVGAVAAAAAIAKGHSPARIRASIGKAIRNQLFLAVDAGSRFDTGGVYGNVRVIDNGDYLAPDEYAEIVGGKIHDGNTTWPGRGTNRTRVTAALGTEVLFGGAALPAEAPGAVVVAAGARAWQGVGQRSVAIASTQRGNDQSIGLVVRFGAFSYFAAGDQLSEGEDLIAAAVTSQPLPRPGGGTFPLPARIPYVKCSHHGGATSTSATYLATMKARGMAISCGKHGKYKHPSLAVVTELYASAPLEYFYLTNCNFDTPGIPGSGTDNQLTAANNKSRVCGDNENADNRLTTRHRGDIRLRIARAWADLAVNPYFEVDYWEEDQPPVAGVRTQQSHF